MKKNSSLLILVTILIVGAFFIFQGDGNSPTSTETSPQLSNDYPTISGDFQKGEKAPDTTFTDFEGNNYSLADFQGKAVVLDFWAAWCPFCLNEMPILQAAQDTHGDKLVMIGVHRTDTESIKTGLKFAKERGASYLLVQDQNDSLFRATGGLGMPTVVYIDGEGIVTGIKSGPKTEEEIEEKIRELITGL